MNLLTNANKADQIVGEPIHHDSSDSTNVIIVSASCTDQPKANIGSADMEQRVVEVVPSTVNAAGHKRRFFTLDDADIQQYYDSGGGLYVGGRDAMDEYLGIKKGGAGSGISKDNILSSVVATSNRSEGVEGHIEVQKPLVNENKNEDKCTDGSSCAVKESGCKRPRNEQYAYGECE